MSLYLDASVVLPLFVIEPTSATLTQWLQQVDETLLLSDLTVTEVGAVISRLIRMNSIDVKDASDILGRFDDWRISATESLENIGADLRMAGQLVRKPVPKLLAADAIHLATCKRLGLMLVTRDEGMLTIARREGISATRPS